MTHDRRPTTAMSGDYASLYAHLYRNHWWWRARESILIDVLRGLRGALPDRPSVVDVGCGDGLFFGALRAATGGDVRGIEVDESLLDPSGPDRDRIASKPLGDPSYDDPMWRADLITALDVLEHIDDDHRSASSIAAMLRPGGVLVATVPAFEVLWDHHDDRNCHRRRYTPRGFRRLLEGSGLRVDQSRLLFPSLFLPKLAVAISNRCRPRRAIVQHTLPPGPINAALGRLCHWEDRLLRRFPMPLGTSVLAVARRPG